MSSKSQSCAFDGTTLPSPLSGLCTSNFFNVSIQEIKDELELLKDSLGIHSEPRLPLPAEAKEYRLSEARRKHLEKSFKNN